MSERPLRADAQRNRARLLDVAVVALADAPEVTLDAIAKHAGVGIGTLYRHFPTREALIEEVYRTELARLCDAVPELLAAEPPAPDRALRIWMDRFIDYMATKRGLADALKMVIAAGGTPFAHSRERLVTAVGDLLAAGAAAGALRADVDPLDLLTAINGICLATGEPAQREQAGRLLDLLMDGVRDR
ncbi:TetR/AcrR family transcriptional regulator [Dactylosporangium sp. NBC_01737]|uniref:TetR/AcrR family transcriptional regulator n=1 Tax=Dactylosporangium sp. NBC_01737 TaxID=2975959 RepID=UPI002E131445|nr:TetR/AcrR family transcriptional regulator [Dactylosporangium sp. NBC_01737]